MLRLPGTASIKVPAYPNQRTSTAHTTAPLARRTRPVAVSRRPRTSLLPRHVAPMTQGTDHTTKNPGNPHHVGNPARNLAQSDNATNVVLPTHQRTECTPALARTRPASRKGTYAAANHSGCVARRAPSVSTPGRPVTVCSSAAMTAHTTVTVSTSRVTDRARSTAAGKGQNDPERWLPDAAQPAATKNTGIGDRRPAHRSAGTSASRFAPRTRPSGPRSITARTRCPATTDSSAAPLATSIAPRLVSVGSMTPQSHVPGRADSGMCVTLRRVSRARAFPRRR